MFLCKGLNSRRAFTIGILLFLAINEHKAKGETEGGFVYKCCALQSTFKDYACDTTQLSSEFDLHLHPDQWTVPKGLRENASEFKLALEPRPPGKFCKEMSRIHQNSNGSSQAKVFSPSNTNDTLIGPPPVRESSGRPVFFQNGSMAYSNKLYTSKEYCFDMLWDKGEQTETEFDIVLFDNQDRCVKQVLGISTPSYYRHYRETWIKEVFAAVAGLSCLFSVVDVIIYLSLCKYLNVSGWTEFAYFVALVLYSALSIPALLWSEPGSTSESMGFCHVLSILLQFFQIGTYSTYLMIAFDVYWMLRKSTSIGSYGDDTVVESKLRLSIYYILLLSIPIGITTYGVVLTQGYAEAFYGGDGSIPNYGLKSCFSTQWHVSEYLIFSLESITFLLILLSVNLIFSRLSCSADVEDAPRVSLLSNMFFFTLIYWIVDLLQFARPLFMNYSYEQGDKGDSEIFWIVLEGFGYAQGILAFIVFVFNRKTLRAFRRKAGSDGTLKEIFRHACCGSGSGVRSGPHQEDLTPMSPLMKTTSMRRSTVRRSHLY